MKQVRALMIIFSSLFMLFEISFADTATNIKVNLFLTGSFKNVSVKVDLKNLEGHDNVLLIPVEVINNRTNDIHMNGLADKLIIAFVDTSYQASFLDMSYSLDYPDEILSKTKSKFKALIKLENSDAMMVFVFKIEALKIAIESLREKGVVIGQKTLQENGIQLKGKYVLFHPNDEDNVLTSPDFAVPLSLTCNFETNRTDTPLQKTTQNIETKYQLTIQSVANLQVQTQILNKLREINNLVELTNVLYTKNIKQLTCDVKFKGDISALLEVLSQVTFKGGYFLNVTGNDASKVRMQYTKKKQADMSFGQQSEEKGGMGFWEIFFSVLGAALAVVAIVWSGGGKQRYGHF